MTQEQFEDGLAYAEDNFLNDRASHLWVDKQLIKEKFDLNGKRVLDFGCGMGGMTLWFAKNWNCRVYGLDIDHHHIRIAQHLKLKYQVQNVEFEMRNIFKMPFDNDEKFDAVLDYIAPKGVEENGAIQFEIKGTLKQMDSTFIRAGLSANASIILDKAEKVLAIKEALVWDTLVNI